MDRRTRDRGLSMNSIEEVLSRVFGLDRNNVNDSSSPETVEGWDSMGHLNLICALESDFNVSIDIGDAMEMVNVGRIRSILREYGVRG